MLYKDLSTLTALKNFKWTIWKILVSLVYNMCIYFYLYLVFLYVSNDLNNQQGIKQQKGF